MAKQQQTGLRRPHARKPFQQGDLDGLCGVYSIVNTVRILCPEVDLETAEYLFDILMQKLLRTAVTPSLVVTWGIRRLQLMALIEEAIAYMIDDFDIHLKMRRLPKALRAHAKRDDLWQYLQNAVSPKCVAILGLSGKHSHWTVAREMSSLSVRLFDSGRMRSLARAQCTVRRTSVRHQITPTHVLLIERI